MVSHGDNFDAAEYWRKRVKSGSDVGTVGHRSMGLAYNTKIYERRVEVLDAMLVKHITKPIEELRILDIGCGSGFYTDYWAERGVSAYVGLDVSEANISHLSGKFQNFCFVNADITKGMSDNLANQAPFDVVTVFDVLYHIVNDERFAMAVRHIGQLTADSGVVFVMDQLHRGRYQLSKHVVYRDRDEYVDLFDSSRLDLADTELLFHYLIPPISGYRPIDITAAALFKLTGLVLRTSDQLASLVASRLQRLDKKLRSSNVKVSNSEMLAFRKHEV
jgi:SAM-dependent methyltransferase